MRSAVLSLSLSLCHFFVLFLCVNVCCGVESADEATGVQCQPLWLHCWLLRCCLPGVSPKPNLYLVDTSVALLKQLLFK